MEKKIKGIYLLGFSAEYSASYLVGYGGVTEIKEAFKNGEMAKIKYYEIYSGDKLIAELHHFSEVKYG